MAKAKIVTIDLADVAEDVLDQLSKAKLVTRLNNADDTKSYVAARGVNKSALKKAMKADEVEESEK